MKIRILSGAKEDLWDGFVFYEKQERGIGDYFLDSISADIDSLLIHHGYHRQFFGFHRMIARTFPFCIYYRIEGEAILVDAVVDQRRNPGSIKRLLRQRG